jgi:hypothetical protein
MMSARCIFAISVPTITINASSYGQSTSQERWIRQLIRFGTPYSAKKSSSSADAISPSSSPSSPDPSKNRTLFPSIHSMPSVPLAASTKRSPGTLTPQLSRLSLDPETAACIQTEDSARAHELLRQHANASTSRPTRHGGTALKTGA